MLEVEVIQSEQNGNFKLKLWENLDPTSFKLRKVNYNISQAHHTQEQVQEQCFSNALRMLENSGGPAE